MTADAIAPHLMHLPPRKRRRALDMIILLTSSAAVSGYELLVGSAPEETAGTFAWAMRWIIGSDGARNVVRSARRPRQKTRVIAEVAIWAGLCVIATAVLVAASKRIGRLRAAAWMITIAAVLLVDEDPGLLLWMASVGPSTDSGGVLTLVSAHTRAQMYGGAAWSVAAILASVFAAHGGWPPQTAWLLLLGVC